MRLDPFETYQLFMAVRSHFTQDSYDFFKYNGKVRMTKDSFMTNKDRFKYAKLARQYHADEMRDFIVANVLADRKWIGELLDDDANDIYKAFQKRKQSLSYNFKNEVEKLFDTAGSAKKAFAIENNDYPLVIEMYNWNDISIETLAILNDFIKFAEKFDQKLDADDVIWSRIRKMMTKLLPFLDADRHKLKGILKEIVDRYP